MKVKQFFKHLWSSLKIKDINNLYDAILSRYPSMYKTHDSEHSRYIFFNLGYDNVYNHDRKVTIRFSDHFPLVLKENIIYILQLANTDKVVLKMRKRKYELCSASEVFCRITKYLEQYDMQKWTTEIVSDSKLKALDHQEKAVLSKLGDYIAPNEDQPTAAENVNEHAESPVEGVNAEPAQAISYKPCHLSKELYEKYSQDPIAHLSEMFEHLKPVYPYFFKYKPSLRRIPRHIIAAYPEPLRVERILPVIRSLNKLYKQVKTFPELVQYTIITDVSYQIIQNPDTNLQDCIAWSNKVFSSPSAEDMIQSILNRWNMNNDIINRLNAVYNENKIKLMRKKQISQISYVANLVWKIIIDPNRKDITPVHLTQIELNTILEDATLRRSDSQMEQIHKILSKQSSYNHMPLSVRRDIMYVFSYSDISVAEMLDFFNKSHNNYKDALNNAYLLFNSKLAA